MENAIGRMRRFLPRKTDLATLTQERFCQLVQACNNTPRQCLGYNTPAEVFSNQVLPFNCESTSLLRAGKTITGDFGRPNAIAPGNWGVKFAASFVLSLLND